MASSNAHVWKTALQWQLEQGVDEALAEAPVDRTDVSDQIAAITSQKPENVKPVTSFTSHQSPATEPLGAAAAKVEALKLAQGCNTLEELKAAIAAFEGLSIKKTATNIVFCDGNPKAQVMVVGEAPGADEDRQGKPFVGASGQLLDRIFECIGLERGAENPDEALYISNILNWRPPGNRTPSPAEIEISLPFIEKHIALIQPKILVLCGGVPGKALLGRSEGISRLRGMFHSYVPLSTGLVDNPAPIQALATYHPAYLLRSPGQKKLVWADMLLLKQKLRKI